jgi:hypothetical protein
MTSPFVVHRDKVLGHYSTASWLRRLVLSMWNGTDYPVGLANLTNLDDDHANAAFEMMGSYREYGEKDWTFMTLANECRERQEQEEAAQKRADDLEWWMSEARKTARNIGLDAGITDDMYSWFENKFDTGFGPSEAACLAKSINLTASSPDLPE